MTFLMNPIAALFIMGSSPLAFQVDHFDMIPSVAPATQLMAAATLEASAPQETLPVKIEKTAMAETKASVSAPRAEVIGARPQIILAQAEVESPTISAPAAEIDVETTVSAEAPVRAQTTAVSATERRAILKAAAASLAAAKTAKGRFVQVSPDGSITKGDFALRRPGRMRFDYDAPTPLLIVADGTTVAMQDSDLETVDRVPLASTPLGIILDDQLDFESETRVTDVRRTDSNIAITVEDKDGESEGSVTLYFDASNYQLLSWRALDANRQTTHVALEDIQTNVNVDPRLFRMDQMVDDDDDER
ncbi:MULTISPECIES: LolA family protein [Henriciella]|jgi:outer membrane lipoprotein-sorting protein|uniref:LolA family protein n=1 Tax=Henriciella TaxID=453849 RepID=UPI0035161FD7